MRNIISFAIVAFTVFSYLAISTQEIDLSRIQTHLGQSFLVAGHAQTQPAANKVTFPSKRKQRVQAQLDVQSILSDLQQKVNLRKATPKPEGHARAPHHSAMREIKRVETKLPTSVESDYSIPGGDFFLDRGASGEYAPSDDEVY